MAEPLVKVILDTSIYIPFINEGITHPILELEYGTPLLYMSAVVIEELYAGASDNNTINLNSKSNLPTTYLRFRQYGLILRNFTRQCKSKG